MLVLIKTLLFLVLVVLLVYGCFHLAKKRALFLPNSRVKVIEHKRLDQKFSIILICVDDVEMIVVAAPQGATIKKIPSKSASPIDKKIPLSKGGRANAREDVSYVRTLQSKGKVATE